MTGRTVHMCLSVRGALKWYRRDLKKMFRDPETGEFLNAERAKEHLLDLLASGNEVIPLGKCDNFDPKDGCQGHPTGATP